MTIKDVVRMPAFLRNLKPAQLWSHDHRKCAW